MRRLVRRSLRLGAFVVLATGAVWLSLPRVTVACSCPAAEDTFGRLGDMPGFAVFAGTAGLTTPEGLPVTVTTWFHGPGIASVVFFDVDPTQASLCGGMNVAVGRAYLFGTGRLDDGRFRADSCGFPVDLGTDYGQGLLEEATTRFGGITITDPPAAPEPAPSTAGVEAAVPLVLVGLFVIGLVAGVLAIVHRRTISDR